MPHKNAKRIATIKKAIAAYNTMVTVLASSPHDVAMVHESLARLSADLNAQLELASM
jgi:cytochrome c556